MSLLSKSLLGSAHRPGHPFELLSAGSQVDVIAFGPLYSAPENVQALSFDLRPHLLIELLRVLSLFFR